MVSAVGRIVFLATIGVAAAVGRTGWRAQGPVQEPSQRPVRVLLGSARQNVSIEVSRGWRLLDGERLIIPEGRMETISIERNERGASRRLRVRQGNAATGWLTGVATIEPATPDDVFGWGGRTYRGVLLLVPTDSAILIISRVDVEDYLRGVVPLEVGAMQPDEHAAVEAQAVAARSFTYSRMLAPASRSNSVEPFGRMWDLVAQETDQVYGGAGVENFLGDLAVAATAGWVLTVDGRVVIAPYHAICGGTTAMPSEVWRGGNDRFHRSIADEGPTPGRTWCDIAPRFAWTRRIPVEVLAGSVARHGPTYAPAAAGVREVRRVSSGSTTASGRVSEVAVETDRGVVTLRGNDIRFVLRPDGIEVLPSTRFSVTEERSSDGRVRALVFEGRGHGHGVGMCQWGAIGRARAGHDFRAILRAYYPGADLTRAP